MRFNLSSGTTTSVSNLTNFTNADWVDGFVREHAPDKAELLIEAFQLVPLYNEGIIRMYFEARDVDDNPRLYSIDSLDYYVGTQYSSSTTRGVCGFEPEYQPDLSTDPANECLANLEIDIDSTYLPGGSGMSQIRQSKIGFPVRADWRWDTGYSAFMVMTGRAKSEGWDGLDPFTCPHYATEDALFYANWNSGYGTWDVVQDEYHCAKALVPSAHGPVPVHLWSGRYKMYYEDTGTSTDLCEKPLRLIFANATEYGSTSIVEYEDWDAGNPVDVEFYWPTGTALTPAEESGLGDHMVLNLDDGTNQIMYVNLNGKDGPDCPVDTTSEGIGAAKLMNP